MTRPPAAAFSAVVQRVVLVAGLLVIASSVLASVLGAFGAWRPLLVWPLLLIAVAGCWWVVRELPTSPLDALPTAALVVVSAVGGWWAMATHSEQLLPRRDSGSNLQAAIALADTGRRILPVNAASIGGSGVLDIPGITLASPAFFEIGNAAHPSVQPQFVIGPGAVFSLGRWAGGLDTMLAQPAWLTAIGVLAVGLIVALCVGPWWGPVAAAALWACLPLLHTARSTYSEPLAMVTLGAGLLAWVLASRFDHARAGLLAGLLIGGTAFVRADGLRESILLIPVAALGLVQGRRWARPMLVGVAAATLTAALSGLALANQYLGSIAASLVPLAALGIALVVASAAAVVAARRGVRLSGFLRARLPLLVGALVTLIGLVLASRPLWMTVRQSPNDPGSRVVAGLQQRQGLLVDGGRTYAEHTVNWLAWWVGWPALIVTLAALAGLIALIARHWSEGAVLPDWTGPLLLAFGSTVLTLYRPGITPDHPWAERRLLIAIPLIVVAVLAAAAFAWRWLAATDRLRLRLGVLVLLIGVLVPLVTATWPHRSERVEAGESGPIAGVCRSLHPGDVVLAVDSRAANEWPQVVRGMCDRPALSTSGSLRGDPAALAAAIAQIRAGLGPDQHLVLLAADSRQAITTLGATPAQVAAATVFEDARLLERRPNSLVPLNIEVWLARL